MNIKFVVANMLRFTIFFFVLSIGTTLAQFFIWTPDKTWLMLQWCFYTGTMFGAMEAVVFYLLSILAHPIKIEN